MLNINIERDLTDLVDAKLKPNIGEKVGVLLLNTGTPSGPDVKSVRKYLAEFLSDPRVIDLPAISRYALLYGAILPFRPFSSAKAYKSIWTDKGSPLLVNSREMQDKLNKVLPDNYVVELGMCYGEPSINHGIDALKSQNVTKIILLPLFPHYASASTGAVLDKALSYISKEPVILDLNVKKEFYAEDSFISSWVGILKPLIELHKPDHILFSYHGLPVRQVHNLSRCSRCEQDRACPSINSNNRDCYRAQSYHTSKLIAKSCDISNVDYSTTFQSRLGRIPWIKPYTDEYLEELRNKGVENLLVACPSFVIDCLETIEEIGMRAAEDWSALGGGKLILTPCLNSDTTWVEALAAMIMRE